MGLGLKRIEAKARLVILEQENADLEKRGSTKDPKPIEPPADESLWNVVDARLKESHEQRWNALNDLQQQGCPIRQQWKEAADQWTNATRASLKFRKLEIYLDETADAPLWDVSLAGIALWGVVALLAGALFAAHEARRPLRRRFRSSPVLGAICLLLLLLGVVGCGQGGQRSGGHVPDRLAKERDSLDKERKKIGDELTSLEEKVKEAENKIKEKRVEAVNALARRLPQNRRGTFHEAEEKDHKALRELLIEARKTELAADEGAAAIAQVQEGWDRLAQQVARRRLSAWERGSLRVGTCLLFSLLAFLPLVSVRRRLAREQREDSEKCPRCLATGTLTQKENPTPDPRYPEPEYVECGECQHEFRAGYRKLPRLCFPTVGVRASGKTHWLVTAYDLIKHNKVPVRAALKKAPSLADDEFDTLIEAILEQRVYSPTRHQELPSPLTFHLTDPDRLGPSQGLLNLFDFSGELTKQTIRTDALRRRALLMDGFVLFLDPTLPDTRQAQAATAMGSAAKASTKEQVKALTNFYEEMCDMRKRQVGTRLSVPVAVCISKIDLLTRHGFGGHAIDWIRELRATRNEPVTLKMIQHRSEMCRKSLKMMFRGWDVERALSESFGRHFLFFPLTPVSLEEAELGNEDNRTRTFAPFGILEPILWLLHMRGFCVLD